MKNLSRFVSLLLIAMLLMGLSVEALADDTTVFLPSRIARLNLPEDVDEYDGDPFQTGYEGAHTVLYRESVKVPVKPRGTTTLEYVSKVVVTYPAGNYIRKVVAEYRNDKKNTLSKYMITYQVSDKEFYTITYAAQTNSVLEFHYDGALGREIEYEDLPDNTPAQTIFKNKDIYDANTGALLYSNAAMYVHHYTQDQILEGVYKNGGLTLKNGVGKYFGSATWFNWDAATGKVVKSKMKGLKKLSSFVSPRVE